MPNSAWRLGGFAQDRVSAHLAVTVWALLWPVTALAQGDAAGSVGLPQQGVVTQPVAQPLSAIDWLSDDGLPPDPRLTPPGAPLAGALPLAEPPVSNTVVTPDVTVTPLDSAGLDAVGLLPASVSGLPLSLWQGSRTLDLVALIDQPARMGLPAMQALLYTLLLAEADAPLDAGQDSRLLQARIDALMRLGAVEPAQALLERAGPETPELFGRWFDATLLTGAEDTACAALMRAPHLSPSYGAQVFCMARRGDWAAGMLTLDTARALDALPQPEADLLARFMDPELFEDLPLPRAPVRPSPLVFRLYEALGEPLPTAPLPRAFAVADLRDTAGWRAQIEAAERLASSGALAANRLLGIYSARKPAASGGVWDRVAAVQRFDEAIRAGDPEAVAESLPRVWSAMQAADLGVAFASLYSPALLRMTLEGPSSDLAYGIALLGSDYESAALAQGEAHPEMGFVTALAKGQAEGMSPAGPVQEAIARGFGAGAAPADMALLLSDRRLGEAILRTIQMIQRAAQGDPAGLADGIATLRAVGLEDTARRAALQLILMDHRG
ncbi:MAG: hypothetical protein R3197_09835 [Paracoccaceae bacterium]|nr:hypothetical protein [Paracoccaceae bacterium]